MKTNNREEEMSPKKFLLLFLFLTVCSATGELEDFEIQLEIQKHQTSNPRQERRLSSQQTSEGSLNSVFIETTSILDHHRRHEKENELLTYYEDIEDLNDVLIRDIDQEPERPEGPHRGLVPQLWANFTAPTEPPARNVSCAVARLKCAQRDGCGLALRNYFVGCSAILDGESGVCTTRCRYALIALMSTHEGKRLMKCDCSGDSLCRETKSKMELCKTEVMAALEEDSVVSCSTAQWICAGDPTCAKAFEYYDQFCGAMFRGKKCTARCLNSIQILRRQNGARKLESCYCDGTEDYNCAEIKDNMAELCFPPDDLNEIEGSSSTNAESAAPKTFLGKFALWVSLIFSTVLTFFKNLFSS